MIYSGVEIGQKIDQRFLYMKLSAAVRWWCVVVLAVVGLANGEMCPLSDHTSSIPHVHLISRHLIAHASFIFPPHRSFFLKLNCLSRWLPSRVSGVHNVYNYHDHDHGRYNGCDHAYLNSNTDV